MEQLCHVCWEMVEGEDLGDHPDYLSFYCECGHSWGCQTTRSVDGADFYRMDE